MVDVPKEVVVEVVVVVGVNNNKTPLFRTSQKILSFSNIKTSSNSNNNINNNASDPTRVIASHMEYVDTPVIFAIIL